MNSKPELTPKEIIEYLDRYIIGQNDAKRAVAIAMRNRWRRLNLSGEMKDEVSPKNIIMIGPTGVGKTEIARRLAKLASAPFVKVEATKFTEVGYVGKDVESMIRELADQAMNMVKEEEEALVLEKAKVNAEERLLDILLPSKPRKPKIKKTDSENTEEGVSEFIIELNESSLKSTDEDSEASSDDSSDKSREKMRKLLKNGKLNDRMIELDIKPPSKSPGLPMVEVISTGGSVEDIGKNIRDMFSQMMPGSGKKRKVKVSEALEILIDEEVEKLIDPEEMTKKAIDKVENSGMVFIDEIDKISSKQKSSGNGPEVSREGVQRDILPIVEGSRVSTKYGYISTDHILFIAAGAFHISKPSDLIPELQGRFPIRVELNSLSQDDFFKILTEPKNSLVKQYCALMETEGVTLKFKKDGLKEIAKYSAELNDQMENIGARRLHTIMEKILDDISFSAPERSGEKLEISSKFVRDQLEDIVKDQDLSRYIL
jgi:ATP-dependent HslUV protease ATP-binding subunit HslU